MNHRKYTCLQLTPTCIRAVVMRGHKGSWKVTVSGQKPLPEASEGADLFHHPALTQTVRDLFNELSLQPQKMLLSIPGNGILLKRIQIPAFNNASETQLDQVLAHELPDHISVPLDEAAYDVVLMRQTDDTNHLLIAWMRKEPLASLASRLEAAGIEPVYVMPSSLTLANQLPPNEDPSQRMCGIHIDGEQLDLVVIEDGQVMGGRSFSMRPLSNATALSRMLEQSLAAIPNPNETELARIILFQTDASEISPLTLDHLKEQLNHFDVRESADEWASALLRGYLKDEGISINLLTPILGQRVDAKKQRQRQQMKRLIPVAAALCLIGANVGMWQITESAQSRVEMLHQSNAAAQEKEKRMKGLREKQDRLEKRIAEVAWGNRRFPPLTDRLVTIAESIPNSVRLTEIKTLEPPRAAKKQVAFDARETFILVGVADSQEEIDAFRIALATQGDFSAVRQIQTEQTTIKGKKWLMFRLSLKSQMEHSDSTGAGG